MVRSTPKSERCLPSEGFAPLTNADDLSTSNRFITLPLPPNRMGRHFHFKPIRYLMRVEPDGTPHAKERNVIVLNFFVYGAHGNTEQPSQLLDRESFLLGAQLLNESHLDECLQESRKRRAGKAATAELAALLFTNLSPLCGPVQ